MSVLSPLVTDAAIQSYKKWRVLASVSLSQYILESNWGRDIPLGSNNPFGIKRLIGLDYVMSETVEYIHAGKGHPAHAVHLLQPFAKFNSIADAFDNHAKLLASKQCYAPAMAHSSNYVLFCGALTGVYATDPQYGQKLINIIHSNNLERYDK